MAKSLLELRIKLQRAWLKLLKAEVNKKTSKAAKLEAKIIALELKLKNEV